MPDTEECKKTAKCLKNLKSLMQIFVESAESAESAKQNFKTATKRHSDTTIIKRKIKYKINSCARHG